MAFETYDGTTLPLWRLQLLKSGTWTDVPSSDLRSIDTKRGRVRADVSVSVGQAIVVLDNYSGLYDPDNLNAGSPWVVSGASILRTGLGGRVIATFGGTTYVIFTGVLQEPLADAGLEPLATFTFVDALQSIGAVEVPATSAYLYNLETTSSRVSRILSIAGFTGTTSLSGALQMQPTISGKNARVIIDECVAAQAGAFYVSRTGVATLLQHTHKFSRPTAFLFDDTRSVANSIEYDIIKTNSGAMQVINQAIVTRGKYTQKVATYNPSVSKWGVHTFKVESLVDSAVHAQNLALYYARKDATPTTSVTEIGFDALTTNSALFPDILTAELMDQFTVNRTTSDGRNLVMYQVLEGIDHSITAQDWRVTCYGSPMNSYTITI